MQRLQVLTTEFEGQARAFVEAELGANRLRVGKRAWYDITRSIKYGLAYILVDIDPMVPGPRVKGLIPNQTNDLSPIGTLTLQPAILDPAFDFAQPIMQAFPAAIAAAMRGHEPGCMLYRIDSRYLRDEVILALYDLGFRPRRHEGDTDLVMDAHCICPSARVMLDLCRGQIVKPARLDRKIVIRHPGLLLSRGTISTWQAMAGFDREDCLHSGPAGVSRR